MRGTMRALAYFVAADAGGCRSRFSSFKNVSLLTSHAVPNANRTCLVRSGDLGTILEQFREIR